jgi:hypothetical protein
VIVVVVLVLACLAVLGAVVALAMGLGGELSPAHRDRPPPAPGAPPFAGPSQGPRLPRGLWGYQADVADRAIDGLLQALRDREARMAALERQVADLEDRLRERGADDAEEPAPPAPPWEPAAVSEITKVDLAKNNGGAADPEEARP